MKLRYNKGQNFAVVDGAFEEIPSNVENIVFSEEQAGYAAGLVAANMTNTNKVGFVGGFDLGGVRVVAFGVGFVEKGQKIVSVAEVGLFGHDQVGQGFDVLLHHW